MEVQEELFTGECAPYLRNSLGTDLVFTGGVRKDLWNSGRYDLSVDSMAKMLSCVTAKLDCGAVLLYVSNI